MSSTSKDTETLILDAARKVFITHGYDGTSMQMIAGHAGINKALLHYYYRSKDRLFEAVFTEAFGKIVPHLRQILLSDIPFLEKIGVFVDGYITALQKVPEIPLFILHELRRNPERVVKLVSNSGIEPLAFIRMVENEIARDHIRPTDPTQLLVNILAMCIFPFAAKPIIQGFILNGDEKRFETFLEQRKKEVTEFIINALRI